MLRRLHHEQPDSFAFTPANREWAEAQITKYPKGRQASAIIPLLWRAQEQEGWLSRPAIEHVADMLEMDYIRALEVATFYFMFHLAPVGSLAHIQICGTTSCMICGAEDLVGLCRARIAPEPHQLSQDGRFSWEEVECLGACANAPMAQIGKDYYEDLTAERLEWILDELAAGRVPPPGPQNGRFASEPAGGLTSLDGGKRRHDANASVALARDLDDTIKRIDGSEVPLVTPWRREVSGPRGRANAPAPGAGEVIDETGVTVKEAPARTKASPGAEAGGDAAARPGRKPELLKAARGGAPDDLKKISGVGPKLEQLLNSLGVFHFDQIAQWGSDEIAWIDAHMDGFRGRAERDEWVAQARELTKGNKSGDTAKSSKGDR